jgi:hypothetical protein
MRLFLGARREPFCARLPAIQQHVSGQRHVTISRERTLGDFNNNQKEAHMKHVINLADEYAKLGINAPSEQLLDAAAAEAERLFVLKPALILAFNTVYGVPEKRRNYVRKNQPITGE